MPVNVRAALRAWAVMWGLIFFCAAGQAAALTAAQAGSTTPTPESSPASQPVAITLLHVNDMHGHLEPHTIEGRSVGGYARLSTLVNRLRAASNAQRVFLIHAGDEFSRGDDLTTRTQGAANVELLNYMKFDVWTPGNGEFYDGINNLEERIRQAHFPVLAANIVTRVGEKPIAKPYVIEQVGPLKVAFLGLCFIHKELPSSWALKLEDPVEVAARLVPQLRKQADLVVAVTHLGFDEDTRLAKEVDGIDVIIGGHSHTLNGPLRGRRFFRGATIICQAGEYCEHLGKLDLTLTYKGGHYHIETYQYQLLPVDAKVQMDPGLTALIARLSEQAASQPATQGAAHTAAKLEATD